MEGAGIHDRGLACIDRRSRATRASTTGAPMPSVSMTELLPEHSSDTLALITAARHGAKTWREPGDRSWQPSKAENATNELASLSHSPGR